MSNIITLSPIESRRLRNAEHVQLFTDISKVIELAEPAALGLPESIYAPFNLAVGKEQDIVNKAQGSTYTKDMEMADKERNTTFHRIYSKLDLCQYEAAGSVQQKASDTIQKHLVGKYPLAITKLPKQERTATLSGFILDCRERLSAAELEAIKINDDLTELEDANRTYNSLYQSRVVEKSEVTLKLSLILRENTEEAYKLLQLALNFLANDPTPAKSAQTEASRIALKKVNVVIDEAKQKLLNRIGGGSGAEITEISSLGEPVEFPFLLNKCADLTLKGYKLAADTVKFALTVQPEDGPAKKQDKTIDELMAAYGGTFDKQTDPETGIVTITLAGMQVKTGEMVTVEEIYGA